MFNTQQILGLKTDFLSRSVSIVTIFFQVYIQSAN